MNKILLVDDAAFMRSVIRGILEKGGYDDFCEAEDGDVAFSRYREYAPYLTILDITMPRQDGIETLRQIIGFDAAARVVMCSAIGQEPQIVKADARIGVELLGIGQRDEGRGHAYADDGEFISPRLYFGGE